MSFRDPVAAGHEGLEVRVGLEEFHSLTSRASRRDLRGAPSVSVDCGFFLPLTPSFHPF